MYIKTEILAQSVPSLHRRPGQYSFFLEIITGYYENHMKYTNTLYGQIEESFTVKSRGACNRWAKND